MMRMQGVTVPLSDNTTNPQQTALTDVQSPPRPVSSDQRAGCLVVIYGEDIGRRIAVSTEPMLIGRAGSCAITLDQESVSRNHCELRYDGKRFVVRDLGSTNGTYVNDDLVEEMALRDGDQLKVGRTILKFILADNVETQYHEEIYRLMTTDGLTQLHNKRYFDEMLDKETSRARRYRRHFSLLMFDVDHFKQVNDTFGHLAGDAILRQLGAVLLGRVRCNDVIARIGGEEFALIAPEITLAGAKELANKLRRLVAETRFEFEGTQVAVTISVGVADWQPQYEDAVELLRAADEKLYEAKQQGRNRVCG